MPAPFSIAALFLSLGGFAAPGPTWIKPAPGAPNLQRFSQAVIQRWGADYIRIGYYVDPVGLKKHASTGATACLRGGQVWSGTRLLFLTGISAEKRRSVFDAQFKFLWPGGAYDSQRPTVQRFFEATGRRLNRGDTLDYLLDPSGAVLLRHGKEPWTLVRDRELMLTLLGLNYVDGPDNAVTIQGILRDLEALASEGQ